jgi:voltage-gated potassium channel
MDQQQPAPHDQIHQERQTLLVHINALTDTPLIVLSFVWLGLLVLDFTQGLSPLLQTASNIIWAIFALDFVIEFTIAPDKRAYLRHNWLTVVSLLLPALRILRVFRALRLLRAVRTVRSVSLLRLLTSLNRGMRASGRVLGRRGIGYVAALTTLVTFVGAAGMYTFERPSALLEADATGSGLPSYGEAVWWTAMIMVTMGSDYWPQTVEGRILGWLLSLYAFAIFGYITATIASYFVGDERATLAALQTDVRAVRVQMELLTAHLGIATTGFGERTGDDSSSQQHEG